MVGAGAAKPVQFQYSRHINNQTKPMANHNMPM